MRGGLASLSQVMATAGIAFVNALNVNGFLNWVEISGVCIGLAGNLNFFLLPMCQRQCCKTSSRSITEVKQH